jgi:hypothetical protein
MKKLILTFIAVILSIAVFGQTTYKVNVVVQKTNPTFYLRGSGGAIDFNYGNMQILHSTGLLTINGGNLSLGTGSLLLTGSIGATGSRITKGWMTNLELTNGTGAKQAASSIVKPH